MRVVGERGLFSLRAPVLGAEADAERGLPSGANHQAGRAAVVHDYLYATRGLNGRYSRGEADAVFRKALADLGVPLWKRTLLWAAVRVGGGSGWGG